MTWRDHVGDAVNVAARLAKKLIELAGSDGVREEDGAPIKLSVTQKDLAGMIGAPQFAAMRATPCIT